MNVIDSLISYMYMYIMMSSYLSGFLGLTLPFWLCLGQGQAQSGLSVTHYLSAPINYWLSCISCLQFCGVVCDRLGVESGHETFPWWLDCDVQSPSVQCLSSSQSELLRAGRSLHPSWCRQWLRATVQGKRLLILSCMSQVVAWHY